MSKKEAEMELLAVPTSAGTELMPVELRRSPRARRIRLTIGRQGEAMLTIPRGCSREEGIEFLNRHGDWLKKHLERQNKKPSVSLLEYLQKQAWLSISGREVLVQMTFGEFSSFTIEESPEVVRIVLEKSGDKDASLLKLLRRIAGDALKTRTEKLAQSRGLQVGLISVRNQKTRWGSCSDRRTVSLNWRLILILSELQDYIIWHELAHLDEMNHSPGFWELLDTYAPGARKLDREVTRISREVMALGR